MITVHQPGYLELWKKGILQKRVRKAVRHLSKCNLCPHNCGKDRTTELGFCRASDKVIIASYGPHFGEEAPLIGKNGSGTIFFGYCNMRCVFCQNCETSFGGEGEEISNDELAQVMLKLQDYYRCHNINLVTPTHFIPNILEALLVAVEQGLRLPLVYNSGGYEKKEILYLLDGAVDIYMPDFKYYLAGRGEKYSGVKNYPEMVKESLKEMDRQVGGLKADKDGLAFQGLLIRHLMMPGGLEDTKAVLRFIKRELSSDCLVNLMDQYYPAHQAASYEEIFRTLSAKEYLEVLQFARQLGLRLVE